MPSAEKRRNVVSAVGFAVLAVSIRRTLARSRPARSARSRLVAPSFFRHSSMTSTSWLRATSISTRRLYSSRRSSGMSTSRAASCVVRSLATRTRLLCDAVLHFCRIRRICLIDDSDDSTRVAQKQHLHVNTLLHLCNSTWSGHLLTEVTWTRVETGVACGDSWRPANRPRYGLPSRRSGRPARPAAGDSRGRLHRGGLTSGGTSRATSR
jgi:hypothetical protein